MSKKNRNMAKWLRKVEKNQEEILRQVRSALKSMESKSRGDKK